VRSFDEVEKEYLDLFEQYGVVTHSY